MKGPHGIYKCGQVQNSMGSKSKFHCGDPVVRFKYIISCWVLVATFGVSAVVWVFVKNATSLAVDKLAWRMTGVVRVLAREQVCVC